MFGNKLAGAQAIVVSMDKLTFGQPVSQKFKKHNQHAKLLVVGSLFPNIEELAYNLKFTFLAVTIDFGAINGRYTHLSSPRKTNI